MSSKCYESKMEGSVKKADTEWLSKKGDAEHLVKFKTDNKYKELAFPKYVQMRKAGKDVRPEG